jgi:predicted phosphoribosyltransferase
MKFDNRQDAGNKLATKLMHYKDNPNAIILGLPRGGVPVAFEVALELNLPLDIIVCRKIHFPKQPEVAIGAITADADCIYGEKLDNKCVFDEEIINNYNIDAQYINKEVSKEKKEAKRRLELYRGSRPLLVLKGKIVILVDDGIATGNTMLAAIASAKKRGAKKIVAAVPVITFDALNKIKSETDEIIYLDLPELFLGVGSSYENFSQTSDEEVIELMKRDNKRKI